MKVMLDQQQEMNIDATVQALNNWWKQITAEIFEQQRFIYSVHVDDQQLFHGYEQYMIDHIDSIDCINVQTMSRIESIYETEQSLNEYLERFVKASVEISEYFYGDLKEEHWVKFSEFIRGLDWIVKAIEFEIELYKQESLTIPEYLSVFNEIRKYVSELEKSMEQQDYVAVGDLIQYEMVPVLQKFQTRELSKEN